MRVIWVVFSKEFLDIVRNRRRFIWMMISSFIIFPLLFVVPYASILGRMMKQTVDVLTIPVQGMEYAPDLMAYLAKQEDIKTVAVDDVEDLVLSKKYAVGLVIPSDYQQNLEAGHTVEIRIVSDQRRTMDVTATRISRSLEDYGAQLLETRLNEHGFTKDFMIPLVVKTQNAATATETTGSQLGLLIPGMIISLGLTAGMPVAVASIAGEKKNLTLEPVLFSTVSRFQLVFAKLLAVLASVFFNLLASALSMIVSILIFLVVLARILPEGLMSLTKGAEGAAAASSAATGTDLALQGYSLSPTAIVLFLLAPALIILFGAAIQLLISAWARNDEEAYTYLTPLSFFSGLVVFVAFFLDEYTPKLWHYALPVFGTILSMRDLLSNKVDPASLTVMFLSSSIYALLMLGFAVWMFHREEVVFRT